MTKQRHILWRFLSFAYKTYKPYFFSLLSLSLINSAITIFGAYSISIIIEYLENGVYMTAVYAGLIVTGIEILLTLLRKTVMRISNIHQQKMIQAVDHRLAAKILSLPFEYLENPYYISLKKNAQFAVNNMGAVSDMLTALINVLSNIISLLGLGAIIFTFDPILVVILIVGILLSFLIVFLSMKTQVSFYKSLLPINFRYGYYMDTLESDKNSKDFRLYESTYQLINEKFRGFGDRLNKYFIKILFTLNIYDSMMSTIRYIQMGLIYILVGIRTISEHLSIAQFSLVAASAISFSECVTSIIQTSGRLMRAVEYVTPLIELMDIGEEKYDGKKELDKISEIRFDHVTFSYPNTDKVILDDISFAIEANEKISIVGLNGAGKTTIVKLLCRLYHPDSGSILINGIRLEEYSYDSYISKISAVFQDYKLFNYSIRENIRPGISTEEASDICTQVGIADKISQLPKKYESCLSRSYENDGIELSGGQRQKIAIARALAKPCDLLILDEPTSALDPLAEAEIYQNFNSLANGRMAIYISHRMSSSVFCDKILVIDGGKVSDFDSHKNLMRKKDSLYYKLFTVQARNYRLKNQA